MRVLLLCALVALPIPARATPPPDVQLAAQSLRADERARLEKVLGPIETQPTYRVELDVDPARRSATGRVSVTVTPRRVLEALHLRLTPETAHAGAVVVSGFEVDGVKLSVPGPAEGLLTVRFPQPVEAGHPVTVSFKLAAKLPPISTADGLLGGSEEHPGDYGAFAAGPEVVSLVGVVPMVAVVRPDGTLFDGPSGIGDLAAFDPSNFIVAVTAPTGWQPLAPGALTGDTPDRQGRRRVTYALAGARELPVLVVRGYESSTRQVGEVTVESWYRRGDAASGKSVLEHAAACLELLGQRLGPYPYRTLRVVESRFSGGAGGMEFPGLITISGSLYSGATDPLSLLGLGGLAGNADLAALLGGVGGLADTLGHLLAATLDFTVAHEVAHQYFAMLVGNDPVADPVVDEALTQHVALLLVEWRHGKPAAEALRDAQLRAAYQVLRATGGKDGPALRPTSAFESNQEYAALVYGKAPLLFDAWRAQLGDEAWFGTLRSYVAQYRYRWVGPTTLLELAQKRAPDPRTLAALRRRWWLEAHGDEDIGPMKGLEQGGLELPSKSLNVDDPALRLQYEELLKALGE